MSISALKLARVTADSIKKLELDPQAIEKAVDSYQGAIRGDRSVGNNLRRQSDSVENLRRAITSTVPQAIKGLSDIGDQEAYDEWLTADDKQKDIWRKAVKNGDIAGFHSPMFQHGLKKMIAADHVNKYSLSFQENYVKARNDNENNKKFQNDEGGFDFTKWQEHHFRDYSEANGLTGLGSVPYSIFAKGIGPVHLKAQARLAEAKGAVAEAEHQRLFGVTVKGILSDSSTDYATKASLINTKFHEIVKQTGVLTEPYITQSKAAARELYLEETLKGTTDADQFLTAYGLTDTGGGVTFNSTTGYSKWVEGVKREGDEAWARQQKREIDKDSVERYNYQKQLTKDFGKSSLGEKEFFDSRKDEFNGKIKSLTLSANPQDQALRSMLLNMRDGGMDAEEFTAAVTTININDDWDDIKADFVAKGATPTQMKELEERLTLRAEMGTGTDGDVEGTTLQGKWLVKNAPDITDYVGPGSEASNTNQIPLTIRAPWHDKYWGQYEKAKWQISQLKDDDGKKLPLSERRKKAQEALAVYNTSMQKEMDDYISAQGVVKAAKDKETKHNSIFDEWMQQNKKDASLFIYGDHWTREGQTILSDITDIEKYPKGSPKRQAAVDKANQAVLKSKRYEVISKQYEIPLTLENMHKIEPLVKKTVDRVRKERDLPPEDKKKIQEQAVAAIAEVTITPAEVKAGVQEWTKAIAQRPEFKAIAPEFKEGAAQVAVAGIQDIQGVVDGITNMPENVKGLYDNAQTWMTELKANNPGLDSTVLDDLLGGIGSFFVSDAGAADKVVDPTEGVMQTSPESNTGVSGSGRTVSGHTMAQTYNASTTKEKANYEVGLAKVRKQLATGVGLTPTMKKNITMMKGHFKSGVGAFSEELKTLGMSSSEFITAAIEIYGQETVFGTYINPETKAKISSTGARGEMQIVYPTFVDMAKRNIIGDKAYKAMGTTRAKVKAMLHDYKNHKKLSTAEKAGARKFLLDNHKANAVIAMAKMVNGMKAWKDAGNSLYDKVKRG